MIMRKLLTIILLAMFVFNTSFAFDINTISNPNTFELITQMYEKDINYAYSVKEKLWKMNYSSYDSDVFLMLLLLEAMTNTYISGYEAKNKTESKEILNTQKNYSENNDNKTTTDNKTSASEKEEKKKEEEKKNQEEKLFWDEVYSLKPDFTRDNVEPQDKSLKKISTWFNVRKLASFTIEPKYDHIQLKNVYFENTWTVKDMASLFKNIYLVTEDNWIIDIGYVKDNYIVFDIWRSYLLAQWKVRTLSLVGDLKTPNNVSQIWQLKFKLSTPSFAQGWTYNWVRVLSYSNWNNTAVNVSDANPISNIVLYNDIRVAKTGSNKWNSREIGYFTITNSSDKRLEIRAIELQIWWSFLNYVSNDSVFIITRRWTNNYFGAAALSSMSKIGWKLRIDYAGSDINYLSPNSSTEYLIEFEHRGEYDWTREVRIKNVIIWDWFGWEVTDLDYYWWAWLPTEYYNYKY